MIILISLKEEIFIIILVCCVLTLVNGEKAVTLSAMSSAFNVAIMVINYKAGGGYHEIYSTSTRGMSVILDRPSTSSM